MSNITVLQLIECAKNTLTGDCYNVLTRFLFEIANSIPAIACDPGHQGLTREQAAGFYLEIHQALEHADKNL